jgi:hypothetical protein
MTTYDCEAIYDAIKHQIKFCDENHPDCSKVQDKILPTRLLDVGSDVGEPYLISSEPGTVGNYCALSYCWGQSQSILLIQERLQSGHLTFPLRSLPATLRDAVVICRKLGSKYI